MAIIKRSFLPYFNKNTLFTFLLCLFMLWIGLAIGDNMSDMRYWIDSTWMTIKLEWVFIFTYFLLTPVKRTIEDLTGKYRFISTISMMWIATLSVSYLLSPYYSLQNPLALMRLIETITHFLFFITLWDLFRRYRVDFRMVYGTIIFSTLIVLCYFIYIHFAFPGLKADAHVFSIRSEQLVLNTHLHRIGYQVEAAIVLTAAFIFALRYRYAAFLSLGSLGLFLLWLGGRAAILGTVVALSFYLYLYRKKISVKMFAVSAALFTVFLMIISFLGVLDLNYLINAFQKTFQSVSLDHLLSGRLEVWSLVLENLKGHWWLGTGPQSYFFYMDRNQEVIHAHNFIMQFLGEWGILGTSLFVYMIYRALRYGYHNTLTDDPLHLTAGLVIVAYLITGLFGSIFFFQQTEVYISLFFAIWITQAKRRQQEAL